MTPTYLHHTHSILTGFAPAVRVRAMAEQSGSWCRTWRVAPKRIWPVVGRGGPSTN